MIFLTGRSVEPGFGWFRVLGFGLTWKDSSRHRLVYSERAGVRRRLVIGRWRLGVCTPWG